MTAPVRPLPPREGATRIRDTSAQDTQRRAKRRVGPWVWSAIIVLILATAGYVTRDWWQASSAVAAKRLQFAEVQKGDFARRVQSQGRVIAAVSPQIYAEAAGTVSLRVKAGDLVRAGDELAQVRSPELTSRLAQEQATLDSLQSNLKRRVIEHRQQSLRSRQLADIAQLNQVAAARELRRAEAAWEIRVISRQDFEKARDDLDRARVEYEHAAAATELERESLDFELQTLQLERDRQSLLVDDLKRQVARLTVRAPVAGMIGTMAVTEREAVAANQALMSVVDLTAFEVEASIAQSYAERLSPGMEAIVRVGDTQFAGRLRAISPEVTNNSVLARIRFDGQTPDSLRQNQRVNVELTLDSVANALTIPRGPFIDSGGGRVIYVVDGDVATRRNIRLGASSDGRIEVLSGLTAGEQVITSSTQIMRGAERVLIAR